MNKLIRRDPTMHTQHTHTLTLTHTLTHTLSHIRITHTHMRGAHAPPLLIFFVIGFGVDVTFLPCFFSRLLCETAIDIQGGRVGFPGGQRFFN